MNDSKTIFSTAYLPPILYFRLMIEHRVIYLEKYETYAKQTYRNRCVISSANGLLALTIPVIKTYGNNSKVIDVKVDNSVKWKKEHWRALESAYSSSAFFEYLMDYFSPFYHKDWDYLWDYNLLIIRVVLDLLGVDIDIKETDRYIKQYSSSDFDYRSDISPKKMDFLTANQSSFKPYYQVFGERFGFQPNLSIFDLICNCGMDSLRHLYIK